MSTELSPAIVARIARAVVRLPRLEGQGVLVPGCFVATAAHCIGWTGEGMMTLAGEHFREPIATADGRELVATPLAVEPVSDLAVLGAMDSQVYPDEAEAFEAFSKATRPVPLAIEALTTFVSKPAYVFTHDQGVVSGTVQLSRPTSASLWLHSDTQINGGTSGGPVVSDDGRLWGIISSTSLSVGSRPCDGAIPIVHLAAPAWLVRKMVTGRTRRKLDLALPPGRFKPWHGRPPA